MNRQLISELMTQPAALNKVSSGDIGQVVEAFPYFSVAQVLKAKKFKEEGSLDFEKQLNLTAAYVPSRKCFHAYHVDCVF